MSDCDPGVQDAPRRLTLRGDSSDSDWSETPAGSHARRERAAARLLADDAETLEEATRILSHLRVHLGELDRREQSLNGQLTLFDQEQRALRLRMQRLEEEYSEQTAHLAARQVELDERDAECDAERGELDRRAGELGRLAAQLEADRAALRAELQRELESERAQLAAGQQQLARERESASAERQQLQAEQADWERRRTREARELTERLESLRHAHEQEWAQREAAVAQREVDVEKRARFHEDHLARLRSTLEEMRRDLELQRQRQRVWVEQVEGSIRLRLSQLRKFRSLVEQREAECSHGWEQLQDARRRLDEADRAAQTHRASEHAVLDDERRVMSAESKRQHDLLRLREQELLRRGARLDQLRDELEGMHRASLALRAEAEEVWRRLTDQAGPDQAAALAGPARKIVDQYLAEAGESLDAERESVAAARRELESEQADSRRERDELAEALSRREQRLRERENALARRWEQLAAREDEAAEARTAFREDRQAAEGLIRELLEHLESAVEHARVECDSPPGNGITDG